MATKLLQLLADEKIITPEQLQQILDIQKKESVSVFKVIRKLGLIEEDNLVRFISERYGVPVINPDEYKVDSSVLNIIPYRTARWYPMMPLKLEGNKLTIVMADPSNAYAISSLEQEIGYHVWVGVASEESIIKAIYENYLDPSGLPVDACIIDRIGSWHLHYSKSNKQVYIDCINYKSEPLRLSMEDLKFLADVIQNWSEEKHQELLNDLEKRYTEFPTNLEILIARKKWSRRDLKECKLRVIDNKRKKED